MMEEELKNYTINNEIGKGSFSKVYSGISKKTGEKVAVKRINKRFITEKQYKKYLNNEIFILNNVNNPYIIKLLEVIMGSNYLYLVFEDCNGGSLEDCLRSYRILHNGQPFTQEIVQHIMKQIMTGMIYLHSRKILHRDIKLENILVKFKNEEDKKNVNMLNSEIKIIDFGFARYLKGDKLAKSVVGSPLFADPKIVQKLARVDNDDEFGYDEKADIWSLGMVMYELLIGSPAFQANSIEDLAEKIENGKYKIPHNVILSKETLCFLNAMLQYNPEKRYTCEELSKQFFLTKKVSEFKKTNNLGKSIYMNLKSDNKELLKSAIAIDGEDYDPNKTIDNISFCGILPKMETINEEPTDIIEKKQKEYESDNKKHITSNIKNNEDISKIQDIFDKMNIDCFYIEPLLIPTQPNDILNSDDPISQYMDNL